ncbi:unnamed protein product [Prunus brigantina]
MYFTESASDDDSTSDEDSRDSEYSEDSINSEFCYLHHSQDNFFKNFFSQKGEGFTWEEASSTVEGSARDEALTNSTKGSTEDDEKGEGSTEEEAGSTVEGSTRDEPLTNSTKSSTEVAVEGSIEVVVEGSIEVVGCSTEIGVFVIFTFGVFMGFVRLKS